jgi:hypothetical protein
LYENLTTSSQIQGFFQRTDTGKRNTYTGSLALAYTKRLAPEVNLGANLGLQLTYDATRFEDPVSFVSQEIHTFALPFALPIPLDNPFVVESSIVVTKVAVGPLPVGCIPPPGPPTPLMLGQDYTVQTTGAITEIVPIPCSGPQPGINPGDTIAVDYQFTVAEDNVIGSAAWQAGVSTSYRWIKVFYSHEQTHQTLIEGTEDQFLDDRMQDTLGTTLRYSWPWLRASFTATGVRFDGERDDYVTLQLTQGLGSRILPWLTLGLDGSESFTDRSTLDRKSRVLVGRLSLSGSPRPALFTRASFSIRHKKESDVPNELVKRAVIEARWFVRQLEVRARLRFNDSERGESVTKDYGVSLDLIRRF